MTTIYLVPVAYERHTVIPISASSYEEAKGILKANLDNLKDCDFTSNGDDKVYGRRVIE